MGNRLFLTAFEPYDRWRENSSWLALIEFTKSITPELDITTRLYSVDFADVRRRLEEELIANYDYAIHLGQAPGSTHIRLEAVGINVGGNSGQPIESYEPLVSDGPVAYRSELPLGEWACALRQQGIPATLSYHAGTYLCNATLYLTHHIAATRKLRTQSAFVHLPLADSQAAEEPGEIASMSPVVAARALQLIIQSLVRREPHQELV
jgi:pyroglutamyl-peptidase